MQSPMMLRIDSSRLQLYILEKTAWWPAVRAGGQCRRICFSYIIRWRLYIVRELDNISQGSKIRKLNQQYHTTGKQKYT